MIESYLKSESVLPYERNAEALRKETLKRLELLVTSAGTALENAVQLAKLVCETPFASCTLVGRTIHSCRSDLLENRDEYLFSDEMAYTGSVIMVPDASADFRFRDRPLASSGPRVRFIAGVPIFAESFAVGTLWAMDPKPRVLSEPQLDALKTVASQVSLYLDESLKASEISLQQMNINALLAEKEHVSARYESLFHGLPAACMTLDINGTVVDWNSQCTELYGFTPEEAIGQNIFNLVVSPELREFAIEAHKKTLSDGGYHSGSDWQIFNKAGNPLWVQASTLPMVGTQGEIAGVISVNIDITARKDAENRLQSSNEELQQFAYVASHDLMEPVRMIYSYLELIKAEYGDKFDGEGLQFLNYALEGSNRIRCLIKDLLTLSQAGTGEKGFFRVDMEEVCCLVEETMHVSLAEAGATFTWDVLPEVYGDRSQVAQLIQNLVSNSIKFKKSDSGKIHLSGAEVGEKVEFSMTDDGIGIDPRFADKVFQVFQRLHHRDRYPGSGIGLAICQKIITRHGGTIWVDTEYQTGCRIRFTLDPFHEYHLLQALHRAAAMTKG